MESFSQYGSLSNKKSEDLIDGARIKPSHTREIQMILYYGNPHRISLVVG